MDIMVLIALGGSLFSAAVMYVVLDYRSHGERQVALENVLSVQAKVHSGKKTLEGYTKYIDYLPAAKQAALDKVKSLTFKVVRDHVHTENVLNEPLNPKSAVTVIAKYSVEYVIGYELKPESFDLHATTGGIEVRLKKPVLMGSPYVRTMVHEIAFGGTLEKEQEEIKAIRDKLTPLARQYGTAVAAEEAVRALCEKKLVALLSSFLAEQPGVAQVPVLAVIYT